VYFFNQGEGVYHIIADTETGTALCGARMSGIEQWRRETGRPAKRVTDGKPVSLRLCEQCESLLPDSPPDDL
jgi:hypothetical protein